MDRLKELEKATQNAEEELFASQCRRLERDYRKKEYRNKAVDAFVRLFSQAVDEQKEVSWLGICYLHTSLQTGSHEFRLSLYDEDFYLAGEIMETEAFQKAVKAENFSAFFGRYQGEGEILWGMKEK